MTDIELSDDLLRDYVDGQLTIMQFYVVCLALRRDPTATERARRIREMAKLQLMTVLPSA
jgi:anti-sigma factor RsiW